MTMRNEKFEELLTRQLMRELEPQRGKAAAAFQAQVAAEAEEHAAEEREARRIAGGAKTQESWARREVPARALWWWMGVPSLIAACLAVAVTLPFAGPKTIPTPAPGVEIVKDAPTVPAGGILNEGGSGGSGVGGGGTLVDGVQIVPEKPGDGALQGGSAAPPQ